MNCLNNSLVESGAKAEAGVGVKAQKTARKKVEVLLYLVNASNRPPTNSFSMLGRGLRQRL